MDPRSVAPTTIAPSKAGLQTTCLGHTLAHKRDRAPFIGNDLLHRQLFVPMEEAIFHGRSPQIPPNALEGRVK